MHVVRILKSADGFNLSQKNMKKDEGAPRRREKEKLRTLNNRFPEFEKNCDFFFLQFSLRLFSPKLDLAGPRTSRQRSFLNRLTSRKNKLKMYVSYWTNATTFEKYFSLGKHKLGHKKRSETTKIR